MDLTILLSKVLGSYLIIAGLTVLLRRDYYIPVIGTFAKEKFTRMILGFIEVISGLFIVLGFDDWSTGASAAIMIVGWAALLKGVSHLILSEKAIDKMVRRWDNKMGIFWASLLSLALGMYLAGMGFGWFA